MNYQILRNDLKNTKLASVTLVVFILIASLLLSTGAGVMAGLLSSMNGMFEAAKTPHFMQMHTGAVDGPRLEKFVREHKEIESYQLSEFLNVDGSNIVLDGQSLQSSVQDNGLTTQNKKFDYLLDLEGKRIHAKPGELYVPIYYMRDMGLSVGDKALIADKEFKIAGFVRDSQMNAALVSSKRFVVNQEDFLNLKRDGVSETLIEFRLTDPSYSTEIETEYINNGLESNGPPPITYSIFKIINVITDGIFISLLILISLFIVGISILCVRFTIMAKIEEDHKEIGVLKAIGMTSKEISRIYLMKYVFLAGISSLLGYILSFFLKNPFIRNIELTMGKSDSALLGGVLGFIAAAIVFLIIYLYIKSNLKKFKRISPAQALRDGITYVKKKPRKTSLASFKMLSVNPFVGARELRSDMKTYFTLVLVLVISIFLIMVPLKMYSTIEDRSFIRYLGVGDYDIRIDLSQREDLEEKSKEMLMALGKDKRVAGTNLLYSKMLDVELKSGKLEKIKIEFGDHEKFKVNYIEGHPPVGEDEIALSSMLASDLEIEYKEKINVLVDGKRKEVVVGGIYSDITNGGKTAKATFDAGQGKVLWSVISINLKDQSNSAGLVEELQKIYPYSKVSNTEEYIHQVFGSTITAVRNVAMISTPATIAIVFTLTLLFMRMMFFKNRKEIALLKAMGFKNRDINKQYIFKAVILVIVSALIGTLLTNTLGDLMSSKILSLFGAEGIRFSTTVFLNLLVALGLLAAVIIATTLSQRGLKATKISRLIKE
ncbi:MAG: ABC transporter permease [Anaerovoracaceae bacterium]|jgi:putative ABC transport system permease protein